jgi:pilus assembly protein CpaE
MQPLRTLLIAPSATGSDRQQASAWLASVRKVMEDPSLAGVPLAVNAGEAQSPAEGIGLALGQNPDVAVIGWEGTLAPALRAAEAILASQPACTIILVGPPLDSAGMTHAMQAGVREVLNHPDEVLGALRRASVFLQRLRGAQTSQLVMPATEGKVVVVHAPRGGCGKSTLSASLAVALREAAGAEVTLVDLEPQFGSIDLFFNLKPGPSLSDLARLEGKADAEALEQALLTHPKSGVRILPAASSPEDAELVTAQTVEWTISALKARSAWTVIDTGAQLTEPILRALELADTVLVPLTMDMAALRALQQSLKLWGELGLDLEKVQVAAYQQPSDVTAEAAQRVIQCPLSHRLGWEAEQALAAVNAGEPLVLSQPNGAFAKSVKEIARAYAKPKSREVVAVVPAASNPLSQLWRVVRRMLDVPTQSA